MSSINNLEIAVKKLISKLIVILVVINQPVFGSGYTDFLSQVEEELFSTEFKNESLESRINRIELNTLGETTKGSKKARINNLRKVFKFNKSKPPASPSTNYSLPNPASLSPELAEQEAKMNYPAIDKMELSLFNKTYKKENIYSRLARLESSAFKKPQAGSLVERTDRLKEKIFSKSNSNMLSSYNYSNYKNYSFSDPNSSSSSSSVGGQRKKQFRVVRPGNQNFSTGGYFDEQLLAESEKLTFGRSFPSESPEMRLARLEQKLFNQLSPNDSINDRLERIAAVAQAQPSSGTYGDLAKMRKYQKVATGVTVTTIVLLILKNLIF